MKTEKYRPPSAVATAAKRPHHTRLDAAGTAALPPSDKYLPHAGPFAGEVHRYLMEVIEVDSHDYGTKQFGWPKPKFRITTARLNAWTVGAAPMPFGLTEKQLQAMFDGKQRLYYRPRAGAKWVLLMGDIDAHNDEKDALKLARWVRKHYFPGAYIEASDRGYHLYTLIDVETLSAVRFNALLAKAERAIQALASENKLQAKVELKGNFALRDAQGLIIERGRGHTAAVPKLRRGWRDYDRLTSVPKHPAKALRAIVADANLLRPKPVNLGRSAAAPATLSPTDVYLPKVGLEEPDAFRRMLRVGVREEHRFGRPPTEDELLDRYAQYFGPPKAGRGKAAARRGRARDVAKHLARTFDASKLPRPRGYAARREELVRLVRQHVTEDTYRTKRKPSPGRKAKTDDYQDLRGQIRDEVFAVIVFTIELNSFKRQRRADRQWTNGNELFRRMFRRLRAAGLLEHGIPNQTLIVAAKHLAEAAGLTDCFDPRWRHAGADHGICKKYHVGWRHPRHLEFLRFIEAMNIEVAKVADLPQVDWVRSVPHAVRKST